MNGLTSRRSAPEHSDRGESTARPPRDKLGNP